MTRSKKMKFALIESITERKVSYKKRHKGFLKKAHELNTLCDVEIAIVIYSPYHDEPKVFPNHDVAINTFTKFRKLTTLEQSKYMMTQEEFTKQRIKKMEKQLQKVRKKNRVKEFTNKMYEMLNEKDILADMHPYDLKDLSYVINQNLKQIYEAIKVKAYEEGSTSNASQPIAGLMIPDGTNFDGPRAPLLTPTSAPVSVEEVSVVPLMAPSSVPGGTNSEGPRDTLLFSVKTPISLVPPTALSMVPSIAPAQVLQPMFHLVEFLRIPPQIVPLVDPSWVPPSPLFFSQICPPMVPQMYPPIPQQMAFRRAPEIPPPMPPTTMTSPIPSPKMAPLISSPVFPPMIPQMDPLMNMPPMGASMSMNNYRNYSIDFPQSPTLPEMLDWNDDDLMALFDDQSFNNINVQDPNHHNNNNF